MKTVILAGGLGTRLSEETGIRPKPMVEIGGMPILWHIMKMYSSYGHNDFIICLGYKGNIIKDFFTNYRLHNSNLCIDLNKNSIEFINNDVEPWKITLVDTGATTMTGGRLKRIRDYIGDETFFMTYGDGVGDININILLAFHDNNETYATITAVQPPERFGVIDLEKDSNLVANFKEKREHNTLESHWINAGFFVLDPEIFDFLDDDNTIWEKKLEDLANKKQLSAYKHYGYWQNMDTMMDKNVLNDIWQKKIAPWKSW